MVSVAVYLRYFTSDHPTLLLCLMAAAIGVVGMAVSTS
jgi:hypothetical protein